MAKKEPKSSDGPSDVVRTAMIGAAATIAVAIISGIFGLLMRDPPPAGVAVVAAETLTVTPTSTERPLPTPTETVQPTPLPTDTPTPRPARGLLFSTQIAPDGRALDPGLLFAENVSDLYAVFGPDQTPPGLSMVVENPDPDAYYAFLRPTQGSLQTFGWRWFKGGVIINEYEADATGDTVWLQIFNVNGGPLAEALAGPGRYRVVILLDGNPSVSAELLIGAE